MADKRTGRKYYKSKTRDQISESLSKLLNGVLNDEIPPNKANCIKGILQLKLEILDEQLLAEIEELSNTIDKLRDEGEI